MDAEGANKRLLAVMNEVVGQCEVRQAFDTAPHLPLAGTSSAPLFKKELQVDLLFLGNVIDLRAVPSPLARVCSQNPPVVWGRYAGPRISDSGRP